ncbi:hypothetical protein [Spirosoma sp. 209]|uniref:hypothetical protein n=1 Tax=Spirosoma sp. 209 TaxID=1955701 RepID=UPI00098D0F54|nr:hypothetical protein [Spirosoma sp. 209]PHK25180.1 hypothetical protein VF12_37045 [Nostoc linckia z15]
MRTLDFGVTELCPEDAVVMNGGQCNCESGGVAAAKALKVWWAEVKQSWGQYYVNKQAAGGGIPGM